LMMTKQQIIDEAKMSEGDPHAKAQRKRRGMELRRSRSLGDVASADVVVTNPTHFAVALAYAEGSAAPRVVCKGTERMARKIRRDASRNGVPIIENRPLARALYRQVPIGGYVPERFFDDVVKVLVAAYWRRGRVPGHVANRPGMVSSRTSLTGARG
jgi:flagellar biosynthetic protein FlhB